MTKFKITGSVLLLPHVGASAVTLPDEIPIVMTPPGVGPAGNDNPIISLLFHVFLEY